jgi:hypothetical protein
MPETAHWQRREKVILDEAILMSIFIVNVKKEHQLSDLVLIVGHLVSHCQCGSQCWGADVLGSTLQRAGTEHVTQRP